MKNSIKKYQFGNPIKWGQNDWKPVTPQLISDTVNKRKLDKKPVIYYKKGDSNESFPVTYKNWDEAVESSSWARGSYDAFLEMRSPGMPNIMSYPVNILPEVVVEGYRPIKLRTYYPGNKWYPLTGHSRLEIPFNKDEYIDVNKGFNDKGYNLVTNNCSNLTYNFLSKMFGKNEDFNLFTTPGDVREFAIKKLGGKPKIENGVDTVIIPRDGQNVSPGTLAVRATMLADKALENDDERYSGSTYMYYKKGGGIHIKKKNRGKFTEYCGGKVTDACIRKAKSSGNPTLVKRATFAANARKWKHLRGGLIRKMLTAAGGPITVDGREVKYNPNTGRYEDANGRGYGGTAPHYDIGTVVVTPAKGQVVSKPKKLVQNSTFDGNVFLMRPINEAFGLVGKGIDAAMRYGVGSLIAESVTGHNPADIVEKYAFPYLGWLSPSKLVGTLTSGYLPHDKRNVGFGTTEMDLALNTMFDLGVSPLLGKGIQTFGKGISTTGKIILRDIPVNPNNYYRTVGKSAIIDANESGLIRSQNFPGPHFNKGFVDPLYKGNYVIEGTPNNLDWIDATYYDIVTQNGSKVNPVIPTRGGYSYPYLNNSTSVPSSLGFSYWKKYPIIGWKHFEFNPSKAANYSKYSNMSERAGKISDEVFDRLYLRAIDSGDMNRVLAVRNLHFKAKAPNTHLVDSEGNLIHNYHGSRTNNITTFLNPYENLNYTRKGLFKNRYGIYFTNNKNAAKTYKGINGKLYDTYLNFENPYVKSYRQTMDELRYNIFHPFSLRRRFDPALITDKNVDFIKGHDSVIHTGAENIALDGRQIKLADPIVYDEVTGDIIPISLRDNFFTNNINYKQGGKMIRKADDGTKLSFGLKIGNFIKSDAFSNIIGTGLSLAKKYSDNKNLMEQVNAEIDYNLSKLKEQAALNAMLETDAFLQSKFDEDNPNSFGGDIVRSYILNNILNKNLAAVEAEHLKLLNKVKANKYSNFFGDVLLSGLGLLGNYLSGTRTTGTTETTLATS